MFGLSRGVVSLLGPLVVGAAVELTSGNLFDGTQGYGVRWVIIGAAVLVSLPIVRRAHRAVPSEASTSSA